MNLIGGVYPEDLYEKADAIWDSWNELNQSSDGKLDEVSLILMITRSLMIERERCAMIADELAKARCDNGMTRTEAMRLGAESIAAIIRGTSSN